MGRICLVASVAAHAVLLVLLYYFGAYQPTLAAQERELSAARQLDSHAAMRRRVADMERIKALMRESVGEPHGAEPEAVRFDATTVEAPDELLAQAEALSRDIDALDARARADEYARVTGVDREQAAAQIAPAGGLDARPAEDGATAASAPPTGAASATSTGAAPAAGAGASPAAGARIAALEAHARAVLAQRQHQLERAEQGVPVGGDGRDLAVRMAAFAGSEQPVRDRAAGSYGGNDDLFDRGAGQMPVVDVASMRKGAGRTLGPGGEFANRVYVDSWYLIGPFPGKHGRDMFAADSYPPERAVVLDAAYRGKDGRFLTWRYVESPTYPLVPPDMHEDSVYYGYTELMMDRERDLAVWIGADDDAQVWINDRLVWKGGNVNKLNFFHAIFETGADYRTPYNLSEGKVLVRFRKGRNKLFFKLSNGPNDGFFSMVLTPP
jgi:hypothetical protein